MFGEEGNRSDGQNYISEWEKQTNLTFISTRQELENYQDDGNNLIGLFAHKAGFEKYFLSGFILCILLKPFLSILSMTFCDLTISQVCHKWPRLR